MINKQKAVVSLFPHCFIKKTTIKGEIKNQVIATSTGEGTTRTQQTTKQTKYQVTCQAWHGAACKLCILPHQQTKIKQENQTNNLPGIEWGCMSSTFTSANKNTKRKEQEKRNKNIK